MNPNLTPCKACFQPIAKSASKCPRCGQVTANGIQLKHFLAVVLIIIIIVLAIKLGVDSQNEFDKVMKESRETRENMKRLYR